MTNTAPFGSRADDDEDIALSAILSDFIDAFPSGPSVVYLTDGVGEQLGADGRLPAARYGRALSRLVKGGALEGKQIIGAPTRWVVTVPAWTWLQFASAQGIDVRATADRMYSKLLAAQGPADVNIDGFEGLNYWFISAIASELQTRGLIRFHAIQDGSFAVVAVKGLSVGGPFG